MPYFFKTPLFSHHIYTRGQTKKDRENPRSPLKIFAEKPLEITIVFARKLPAFCHDFTMNLQEIFTGISHKKLEKIVKKLQKYLHEKVESFQLKT